MTAIKIPVDAHDQLRELLALTARHGWTALGIDRDDPPTLTSLIEEAVKCLAARAEKRSKR